jgi:valyl-tRNA synthetase
MEILGKNFNHKESEEKIYSDWEKRGLFHAESKSSKLAFSIVIPPPNITGSLHIGHALNNTLQDILVRYKRMMGYNTLWMPGTDHAGIATQNVIEKHLMAEGKSRHEVGRENFLARVWKWKEESGGKIIHQLKRLGCSCDWQRIRFTMDEGLSKAVRKVFVELYDQKLIYRDNYIINWCPRCLTALSDLEVEQKEKDGKLYFIKYPFDDGSGFITVATTRPETMLGDTAVAVNPKDPRFKKFIGKNLSLPLTNRKIKVIGDEKVQIDFGTGALKITPAHDFNDFEIAKEHKLENVNVFTEDGKVNDNGGAYKGLFVLDARTKVLDDLSSKGLLEKTDNYKLIIGSCYRCKTTVEPRMSRQWFVKVAPLAKEAIKAVEKEKTRFIPKSWENTYFDWMENIRDWCISRQLWWGHRIPAWYCSDCEKTTVAENEPKSCKACGSSKLTQDPDVLDTWFSSALWPFSTLGWPDKTTELKTFYPTSLLITSFDIIFFWVARMMMMGLKFMKEVPFRDVFIHALIRDEYGQKMSKSKGNVIDPLEIMDKFGTDAFRFTLAILTVQGRDISLAEKRIVGYRNFVNKLWNASRFILNGMDPGIEMSSLDPKQKLSDPDIWIRTKLNMLVNETHELLGSYKFNESASALYHFVWHEFCDWYIEFSKRSFYSGNTEEKHATTATLIFVLEKLLKLLHPFMPFVTEEIWLKIPPSKNQNSSIMTSDFPKDDGFKNKEVYEKMEFLKQVVASIRNLRMENLIPPQKKISCIFKSSINSKISILRENEALLKDLGQIESINFDGEAPKLSAKAISCDVEILVPMEGLIDIESEKVRLKKEIAKTSADITFFEGRLSNEGYLKKASEELVEKDRETLGSAREKIEKLSESLKKLEELSFK